MTPRLTAPACSRRSISKSLRVLRSVLYGKGDVCLPKQSSSDLSPHLVSSTTSSVRSTRSAPSSCARSWAWCWGTCSPVSQSVRAWSCCSWARSPSAPTCRLMRRSAACSPVPSLSSWARAPRQPSRSLCPSPRCALPSRTSSTPPCRFWLTAPMFSLPRATLRASMRCTS